MRYFDEEELIEFGIDMDLLAEEFARKIDGQVHGGRSDENAGVIINRKFNRGGYQFSVEGYLYIRDEDFNRDMTYSPNGEISIYFENWEELGISPDVINEVYDSMTEELFYRTYYYNSFSDTEDRPALDLYGFDFNDISFYNTKERNDLRFYENAVASISERFEEVIQDSVDEVYSRFKYIEDGRYHG